MQQPLSSGHAASKEAVDSRTRYRSLKRRFSLLVFENEFYQEEVRNLQRKLLKLSRDNNFLLDRLLQYEKVSDSSDADSDATLLSDDEAPTTSGEQQPGGAKANSRPKPAVPSSLSGNNANKVVTKRRNSSVSSPGPQKKRPVKVKLPSLSSLSQSQQQTPPASTASRLAVNTTLSPGAVTPRANVQDIQVCLQKLSPELLLQYHGTQAINVPLTSVVADQFPGQPGPVFPSQAGMGQREQGPFNLGFLQNAANTLDTEASSDKLSEGSG